MNNCLNCGAEIKVVEGRRPRQYCDNKGKCKQEYRRKQGKKQEYVSMKSFKELQAKYEAAVAENEALKNKAGINGIIPKIQAEGTVINYDVDVKPKTYDRTDLKPLQEANKELETAIPTDNHNEEIYRQIDLINKEKIPKERDTPRGRPVWKIEQNNRIKALEKQLI